MSMSKKDFILLADYIKARNQYASEEEKFTESQIRTLADFCRDQNSMFNRERWLDYIAGKCGPNGGEVKK
jgi:hypothetical protein